VKLHFGNEHSQVVSQRRVHVPASRGGDESIQSVIPGPCWPSRVAVQRASPSVNIQADSCSLSVGGCFSRRTSLEVERETDWLLIDGIRELNQCNAFALRERVNAVLTDAVKIIVIDLSQTVHLDSQGLGVIIAFHNRMRRRNGVVRLLNPSPIVQQALELTRLHRLFEIVKCEGNPDVWMEQRIQKFAMITDRLSENHETHPLKLSEPATAVGAR